MYVHGWPNHVKIMYSFENNVLICPVVCRFSNGLTCHFLVNVHETCKTRIDTPNHCYVTVHDNEFEKLLVFIKRNSMSLVACRKGVNEPCMSKQHVFYAITRALGTELTKTSDAEERFV